MDNLVALARAGGVSIDWLATGEEQAVQAGPVHVEQAGEVGEGFVMVPRYDVEASAGHGSFNGAENIVDYMAFREEWVRRTLRVDPSKLVLITAVGDSMEPMIRAGDLLLIDTGVERIIDDAVYILVKRGDLVVKRVQQFFNGAVAVKSDNDEYEDETLTPEDAKEIKVAGRVRWVGRLI